jgi:hypothetical protein
MHPRPARAQGTRDERVKGRDGQRHNGVQDAVCRGSLGVAALVQAAAVAEGELCVGGGEVGVVGRGGDAAGAGGAGEVDCEAACVFGG